MKEESAVGLLSSGTSARFRVAKRRGEPGAHTWPQRDQTLWQTDGLAQDPARLVTLGWVKRRGVLNDTARKTSGRRVQVRSSNG